MVKIELRGLDFDKINSWMKIAVEKKGSDPIFSFISAWIGFNYYYSTFAKKYEIEFSSWSKKCFNGYKGDKAQLAFLVKHNDFEKPFNKFRENNSTIFEIEISLPIKSMIGRDPVPDNRKREVKLKDLTKDQIFLVIYQIRNNLFHGDKDPTKSDRDIALSTFASEFIVPFLNNLLNYTQR